MKILQINNCHYRRGGADVVYLNTGELLERHGHEVYYFSQKNSQNIDCKTKEYFIESIDFFNQSLLKKILSFPRFFYSFNSVKNLDKLINNLKPDIAHIHTYKGVLTPSILKTLKKKSVPIVITLHDYGLICPHNSFLDGKGQICLKCFESGKTINCILNKCNRNNLILSSVSFFEYNYHQLFFPFNIYFNQYISVCDFSYKLHSSLPKYKKKISHLYNFFPQLKSLEIDFFQGKYFLFYGRLSNEKGILTLLKAWNEISSNINLKIVGDGPQKNEILLYLKEKDLKNVEYIGFKQGNELFEILRKASFVIVPSEVNENNPLTIVEAFAYGKPVIASNIGGIPEIVNDNITGFLFTMGDSFQLSNIISKAAVLPYEDYFRISKNARKFAEENFSEESHYNALIDIYNKIL